MSSAARVLAGTIALVATSVATTLVPAQARTADEGVVTARKGQVLQLQCKIHSQQISGSTLWYELHGSQGWVSARYVTNLAGTAPGYC